jgi:Fe2+ transport system protein FeoA
VSLARTLAEGIRVEPDEKKVEVEPEDTPSASTSHREKEKSKMEASTRSIRQVPLHELNVGQRGVIVRVGGKGPVKRRMMDMGLVPGTEVTTVRVAPMGDPVEFEVKGYSLTLRKSEARHVMVEVSAEQAR